MKQVLADFEDVMPENEPKFQVQLGNLPEKVDCKMILTLPREFMAKTNQNESLERDVVDTQ